MLRFVKHLRFLKGKHFRVYSNLSPEHKYNYHSSEILQQCLNYDFKLCDLKLEEISHKIDMIEFQPYEIFFNTEENVQLSHSINCEEVVEKSNKTRHLSLISGVYHFKNKKFLPNKLQEAMTTLELRIAKIFSNKDVYSKNPTPQNDNIVLAYLKDVVKNTHKNAAYIDVCIQKGDYEKAFNLMHQIRRENKSVAFFDKKSLIVDSVFYEPAINVLGRKGKAEFIIKLLKEMDEFQILPSISIVFRCFEAAIRKGVLDDDLTNRLIGYIKKHNISLEDAILQAPISKDNFSYIYKALKTVNPEFEVPQKSPEIKDKSILENSCIGAKIEELEKTFDTQLMNEQATVISLDPVYKFKVDKKLLNKLKTLEDSWKMVLNEAFEKKVALLRYSDRSKLYPFLSVLPTKSYIDIMIQVLYQLSTDNSFQYTSIHCVYRLIGDTIHHMYRYRRLKKQKYFQQLKSIYSTYLNKLSANPRYEKLDELWCSSILENIESGNIGMNIIEWNIPVKYEIGRLLYEIMFENLTFTFINSKKEITTPVLYEHVEENNQKVFVSVKIQSKLKILFKSIDRSLPTFSQIEMPMLHPPIPFSNNHKTGYFYLMNYATKMIRQESGLETFEDNLTENRNLSEVYNALNVLSLCAWKVDNENLDLISKIFTDDGDMSLKIPLFEKKIIRPEKLKSDSSFKEKGAVDNLYADYLKRKKEMFSLWSNALYKISIAKHFRNKRLWFPYSMDFRSRVYPCPPHFNHIGDDVSRGILKFSFGKKLGPNGLNWLKIHLINLCGSHKRCTNEQRLKAANDNLSEIIDSTENPLNGRGWWRTSEKPWQTLLACREIYNALKYADSKGKGYSDDFISFVPVHQDGSCNGLQHYAALGKDSIGASAVNLDVTDMPQDVYSDVLEHIIKKQKIDAQNGITEAIELDGLITRKIIKQSVMTTVYGVTQFGATNQILKQLKEIDAIPQNKLFGCSVYLSKLTLNSIGEIFSSATKIQNWFVNMASGISSIHKQNMCWKTPLNLIVTQPYFLSNSDVIKSNTLKNRNAFPPNFIHSLDSCHMMMTTLRCWKENVTFVSVHDCFWTHACDVDLMNKICREEFIKLHSQPILKNLSDYLFEKYGFHEENSKLNKSQKKLNNLIRNIPETGDFDINKVLKSTYFFS